MRPFLTDHERTTLDQRIADAEQRTGAQIVLAVIGRSDNFTELPWKAFALGAAFAGLVATLYALLRPAWIEGPVTLLAVVATLATGAVCGLACVAFPRFARLFLDPHRAQAEARQYAQSLFLERELFATHGRSGVLLLVSMFERQVVLLPDRGLRSRLSEAASQAIVGRVAAALAVGDVGGALEQGLRGIEKALGLSGGDTPVEDELPNTIIEEQGP